MNVSKCVVVGLVDGHGCLPSVQQKTDNPDSVPNPQQGFFVCVWFFFFNFLNLFIFLQCEDLLVSLFIVTYLLSYFNLFQGFFCCL